MSMNPSGTDEPKVKNLAQAMVRVVSEPDAAPLRSLVELLETMQCQSEALEIVRIGFPMTLHCNALLGAC